MDFILPLVIIGTALSIVSKIVELHNGTIDYNNNENALIGKVGTFDIKRIRIIQLE